MNRFRDVSAWVVGVLLGVVMVAGQPVSAAGPIELKFGTGTTGNDALGIFDKNWMKQLEKNTNGKVKAWRLPAKYSPTSVRSWSRCGLSPGSRGQLNTRRTSASWPSRR